MRLLKALVIGMGVVLVTGLLLVAGTIAFRLSRTTSGEVPAALPASLLADGRLALPAGASVRSMSLDGNRLAVHYIAPEGEGIVIVDVRSGAEIARFAVGPAQK